MSKHITIIETAFGPRRYLALKKTVAFGAIADKQMYDEAGRRLGAYIAENGLQIIGPWTVMYFNWNVEAKHTDMAIAFPVDGLEAVTDPEFSIVDIPQSPASMASMLGPYDALAETHEALNAYLSEKGLSRTSAAGELPVMAVEEYAVAMHQEPNPENWVTNIYYMHY